MTCIIPRRSQRRERCQTSFKDLFTLVNLGGLKLTVRHHILYLICTNEIRLVSRETDSIEVYPLDQLIVYQVNDNIHPVQMSRYILTQDIENGVCLS